jgi:hypothetical protein
MTTPTLNAYAFCRLFLCDVQAVVWCEYCGRWHWHIVGTDIPDTSRRIHPANCNFASDSPYLKTGYRLRLRPMTDAIRADVTRNARAVVRESRNHHERTE